MILKVDNKEKDTEKVVLEDAEETAPEQEASEQEASEQAAPEQPDELAELQKANAELSDKLLRQMAEFDNFRKRTTREKEEIGAVSRSKCIAEILPVLDNFERAMLTECADTEFKKGMEMIFKALNDALKKMGVEEVPAEGQTFNPEMHYAVSTVENEELGSNVVSSVFQKGYQMNGKVIRPAMVVVANP